MGAWGISHLGLWTPDPASLRRFYAELLAADPVHGEHEPLRVGATVLAFHQAHDGVPDQEVGFDLDGAGFEEVVGRIRRLGLLERGPLENPQGRGVSLRDPDGRRIEIEYRDYGVFWRWPG